MVFFAGVLVAVGFAVVADFLATFAVVFFAAFAVVFFAAFAVVFFAGVLVDLVAMGFVILEDLPNEPD